MERNTRQRDAVRNAMRKGARPMNPAEVLAAARRSVRTLSLATVYRTLRSMVESGEAAAVALPGEPARYELKHAAERHHHHFRCERCDRVFDIEGCTPGIAALLPRGFRMTGHDITIFGVCAGCGG
ncbi:MAG: transcriptional repressor [Phycisphaerales bacterium]